MKDAGSKLLCTLLAIALSLGGWYRYGGPADAIDYRTALGDVREVPLPDGSLATLGRKARYGRPHMTTAIETSRSMVNAGSDRT